MNRRALVFALGTSLALGGCLRPDFRTSELDATGTGSISGRYTVDGAGKIALPLIGVVQVGGQTTGQAARAIEGKLAAGYVREPHVTVEMDVYRPFYILGEVTTSGQYPYVNGMTVETAVAIAAGFGPRAARDYAVLTRTTPAGLVSGIVPMTYPVRPGDTLVVKERFF